MRLTHRKLQVRPWCSLTLCSLGILINSIAIAKPANMFYDLDFSVQSDDNVNQAKFDSDSLEDTITSGSFALGYQFPLSNLSALTLSTGLKAQQHKEATSLDSRSAIFDASYLLQRSIGYTKPVYQFSFSSEIFDSATKQRESTIIKAQLIASKRFTDIISGTAGLAYKMRDSESTVFDLNDQRLFISGDYALNKKSSFYSTISMITGETFSVLRPDTDEERYIALSAGAKNIQWDDAFNADFPSQVTRWQAYKVDADSKVFVLGYNYGFGHGNSLDFSYTMVDVSGNAGADYERNIVSGSFLKRF